jgi:hypothetical protein
VDDIDHLLFALRYDGTNLEICSALFSKIESGAFESALARRLSERPTGKYLRRLWFLYEWPTERRAPIPDARQGNYVNLLEPDRYVTTGSSRPSRRHRVNDNLLGNRKFCPMVRQSEVLARASVERLRGALEHDEIVFAS